VLVAKELLGLGLIISLADWLVSVEEGVGPNVVIPVTSSVSIVAAPRTSRDSIVA
jgi:hypothetical protein